MKRLALASCLAFALAACGPGTREGAVVENGDPGRGRDLIVHYGCGTCHTIGGIKGANAHVGPELTGFAENRMIAGRLPNTPDNVIRWIMHPQEIAPGQDMPDLGVERDEARDIAAYLYTQ